MYARVTNVTLHKDKIREATHLYQQSVVPAISGEKGFRNAYLLADSATGEGLSITIWDSEAEGKAYESSGLYKKQVDKLSQFFTTTPALKSYTVEVHAAAPEKVTR